MNERLWLGVLAGMDGPAMHSIGKRVVDQRDVLKAFAHQVAGLDVDSMEDADELRRALLVIKRKSLEALTCQAS